MAVQVDSKDLARSVQRQIDHAVDLWGKDAGASALAGNKLRPFTPPGYARVCYTDVARTFYSCATAEIESLEGIFDNILSPSLVKNVEEAQREKRLLTAVDVAFLRDSDPVPALTVKMNDALGRAYDFGASPQAALLLVKNRAGVQCLEPSHCSAFWSGMQEYAINASATRAVVTDAERWRAFKSGAVEGAERAAEVAGRVLAETGEVVGRVAGGAAGGFVSGFGVAQTALVIGLGYVAWRVI